MPTAPTASNGQVIADVRQRVAKSVDPDNGVATGRPGRTRRHQGFGARRFKILFDRCRYAGKICKPANGKSQLYSADYEAITGLQKIAIERGMAIVVVHHDRNSQSDDVLTL
jgi:hypothetical protein